MSAIAETEITIELECSECGEGLDEDRAGELCYDCRKAKEHQAATDEYWKERNREASVTSQYNNGREGFMISATEAAKLYVQPSFTETEIEEQIRRTAANRGYTCFDKNRLAEESVIQLQRNGFTVGLINGTDFIVSWENAKDV